MACTKYDRDNYPVSDLETEEFSEVSYATEWAVHAAILTEKDRDTDDPRLEALRYVVEVPEEALMVGKAVTEAVVKYRQEKHQAELAKEAAAEKTRQLAACRGALTNLAKMQDELRPEAYAKRLAELRVKYASVYDEAVGA